jgi:nitrogen fixation protein FixH
MKLFFYIVYPIFFFAMACGIYVAYRNAEGLVDTNYYENSKHYFEAKAVEDKLDIGISRPDTLIQGRNMIRINATSHGKPLHDGALSLFIGNLSATGYDSTISMHQLSPGIYQATAIIPFKGVWFARIDLKQQQQLITSKKWFFNVK